MSEKKSNEDTQANVKIEGNSTKLFDKIIPNAAPTPNPNPNPNPAPSVAPTEPVSKSEKAQIMQAMLTKFNENAAQSKPVQQHKRNFPKPAQKSLPKPLETTSLTVVSSETVKKSLPNKNTNSGAVPTAPKKAAVHHMAKTAVDHNTEANGDAKPRSRRGRGKKDVRRPVVRIIPLGGVGEIGKNCTVYESGNDIIVVDCGLAFPDESMLGVDIVIPDFTYLVKNRDKVRGVFVTHGHEDHIGSLVFLLKQINVPIYSTKLTLSLIEGKLREHGLLGQVKLHEVKARQVVKSGCFSVEFIEVNHSIPDACAFAITTPAGVIIQTGDFKMDYTPIQGGIIDIARFGELGSKGVLALLPDSTNAETPGYAMSERKVGHSFDVLFGKATGKRIIVASFASNVYRIQQIVEYAHRYNRKVAVSGRSMENIVEKAVALGYLNVPKGTLVDIDSIGRYSDDQLVLITTGSQGEPMSALSRMAGGDHRKVSVTANDFIIISARPIPGNEKLVNRVVNDLLKLGAEVIYEKMYEVHVSGHACQDELKLMMALTKPKFLVPVHGEFKHMKKQRDIGITLGIPEENIFIPQIGLVMETDGVDFKLAETVTSGRVLVDALGVGDVSTIVLRDRKHLSQDGLIIVVATIDSATGTVIAGPDIVSRGFVYVRESEEIMSDIRNIAAKCLEDCSKNGVREWGNLKQKVKEDINRYVYTKTKRNPMILPVIQEI